jgi:hypothetical protein
VLLRLRSFEARLKNTASKSEFVSWLMALSFLGCMPAISSRALCSKIFSYTQTIPSRFKKDIVRAANQDNKTDTRVGLEGIQQVMANINMEHRISRSEMETIFCEIGGEMGAIPAERFMNLI